VFVAGGQGKYTEMELKRLLASDETGPIGFLATAKLLTFVDPAGAAKVAMAGLENLGGMAFRKDCRLLLEGNSGLSCCSRQLADVFAELSEQEVQALCAVLPKE